MHSAPTQVVIGVAVAATLACNPQRRSSANTSTPLPALTDSAYELADDDDLSEIRDRFDALPGGIARDAMRTRLAGEYGRRIDNHLSKGNRAGAFRAFAGLVGLWDDTELAGPVPPGLARYHAHAERLSKLFSRSGNDIEATAALLVLTIIEPDKAALHSAAIDEIFAYADDLTVASFGNGAERSRPIKILESIVDWFPSPQVVDRLTTLYTDRQRAITREVRANQPDFNLIRAHGDGVLRTSWHIVRIHIFANRIVAAPAALAAANGIGQDVDLRRRLTTALATDADDTAWILLAASFRDDDDKKSDLRAALAVAREATRRFPRSSEAFVVAAKTARDFDNVELAINLFERGLAIDPSSRLATEHLANLYQKRLATLVRGGRPGAALTKLAELERFHTTAGKRWPEIALSSDLAAALATVGEGLVRLGELELAGRLLARSVDLRPNSTALEFLGTMDLKRDRYEQAAAQFEKALLLPSDNLAEQFSRAHILRLASAAYAGAGDGRKARSYADSALRIWREIARMKLRPRYRAERLRETGKLLWQLGDREAATMAFDGAIDADPDGAATHADVVAFLIARGESERALDAYHRALGSDEISDYLKVRMSLWIITEAHHGDHAPDRHAVDYLATRDGTAWHDDLARFATGKLDRDGLAARATTRGRQAKLLYYEALFRAIPDPRSVECSMRSVLDTDMVMVFEYDMAKQWLEQESSRHSPTSSP